MSHTNPAGPVPKLTGEPRQLLFLALCSLALVVAAFAAPPTAQGASPPDVPFSDLFGDESRESSECVVALSEQPIPGREVTVTVRRADEPVEDVRVWFNGRSVGVTNRSGQVEGKVPYVRNLEVAVSLPGGGSCEFVTGTADRTRDRPPANVDQSNERGSPLGASAAPEGPRQFPAQQPTDEVNVTDTYPVHSVLSIDVEGQANPGENVTLVATIAQDPVPAATVSVDGEEVGTTDEDGRYVLQIPDDGRSTLTIGVHRGEISGQHDLDVRLLRVAVHGEKQFPLPGQSATARAAIGTDAVEGADVMLDDEGVGTTDAYGRAEFDLPSDPMATVTVTTGDRTTQTSLLSVFAPTIVAAGGALILLVGGPLAVYWAGGRRGLAVLFGLAANLVTGAAGFAVAGRDGALFAISSTVLFVVLVVFLRRPDLASEAGESTGHLLDSCVHQVTDGVLAITRGVEALIDQTRSSVTSILHYLRGFELTPIAAGIRTWFAALPGRFLAGLVFLVYAPGRLVDWLRPESGPREEEPTADESGPTSTVSAPGPTIRVLWRTFARRVVPNRWPQRTPAEVSRRAIDAGFPRDSVVELTSVFRDVEYGGESLSDDHYQRARTAFDTLDVSGGDDANHDDDDDRTGDATGDATDGGEVTGS